MAEQTRTGARHPGSGSAATQAADDAHDTLLAAALAYTTLGWPVFPCRPGTKVPATGHGVDDATVDHGVIIGWATRRPTPNIGIACGAPGPDVVDVDCKPGQPGMAAMRRLQRAGLLAGPCLLVGTPSGGWHLYFKGSTQPNWAAEHTHGISLRSRGYYVVAPPSHVVDDTYGGPYLLRDARGPQATVDFTRIRRFLDPPRRQPPADSAGSKAGDWSGLVRHVARQAPDSHNRNKALYWAACEATKEDAPETTFAELANAGVSTGLTETASRKTVASARRRFGGGR